MNKIIILAIIAAASITIEACCSTDKTTIEPITVQHSNPIGEFSPTNLIITYDSIVGKQPLMDAINSSGAQIIYDYHFIHGMAIRKPDNMTLDEAIAFFRRVKGVLAVERDHIIRLTDPVKPPLLDR